MRVLDGSGHSLFEGTMRKIRQKPVSLFCIITKGLFFLEQRSSTEDWHLHQEAAKDVLCLMSL
jgi:hypothetical protein